MERVLKMEGGYNFRELGNYATTTGKKIKTQRILRTAALENLTTADLTFLKNYGVDTVIDFRTQEEIQMAPDKQIQEANYFQLPVFKEDETQSTISPTALFERILAGEKGDKKMEQAYLDFVMEDQAKKTYHDFFQHLLAEKNALIFHCTAGKDRTGFGAYLFLSALKVPQEVIYEDYLLTNPASEVKVANLLDEARKQKAPEILVASIRDLLLAKPNYLQTAEAAIAKNYGDTAGFLQAGLGLSKSELQDLSRLYLE